MPREDATILLTRPAAQSMRFAERCRAALPGVRIVVSPILEIRYLPGPVDVARASGVILTSENGARALAAAQPVQEIPAWCVGDRTAEVAAELGMMALSAGGAAEDLVAMLLRDRPEGPLVHIRGPESRGDVADKLNRGGITVRESILYEQNPLDLSVAAQSLLNGTLPVVLPVFSPRSAALVGEASKSALAPLSLVAISQAAADRWTGPALRYLHVCSRPNADAMLDGIVAALRRNPP